MLRSMFTAISSLTLHQEFLDVISDNLANANTAGFKANRVQFQDQFAQLMNPGAGPTTEVGGINPTQIGLGLKLGYISPIFTQGMLQSTGRTRFPPASRLYFIASARRIASPSRKGWRYLASKTGTRRSRSARTAARLWPATSRAA